MPATLLDRYRHLHPDLLPQLLLFFDSSNAVRSDGALTPRTVLEFIEHYRSSHPDFNLQPRPLVEICRTFAAHRWLSEYRAGGFEGLENSYLTNWDNAAEAATQPEVRRLLNCGVYGFPAVYDEYGPSVLPLTNRNSLGDVQIGTCFVVNDHTLVTALHCISPAQAISIRGLPTTDLASAEWWASFDEQMDLACIVFPTPVLARYPSIPLPDEDAVILDHVMAVGYPSVPGFHPALAAEAATISSRLTTVVGRIASTPTEIWTPSEVFLITARVRGGFSGGPVFDTFGQAVGVVSREPASLEPEAGARSQGHAYDNAGYGTAIPASGVRRMQSSPTERQLLDMSQVEFEDFT